MTRALSTLAFVLGCALCLAGCPSTQSYTTARTLDPGRLQHTATVEVMRVDVSGTCDPGVTCGDTLGFIPIPILGYQLRYGVAESLEFGARFTYFGSAGADLKYQLVRSQAFDFAVDPGLTVTSVVGYVNLPLLFSINMGDAVTLTIGPKIGYMFVFGSADSSVGRTFLDGGLIGSSVAIQFRLGPHFAISPGFDYNRLLFGSGDYPDASLSFFTFGLGFTFGALPTYGKPLEAAPPPLGPPPPAAPAQGPAPGQTPVPPPGY